MRAIVDAVKNGRREFLVWVAVPDLGLISVPVQPVRGAYAGVWRDGRLVELLHAAQWFDACSATALAVLHSDLGELEGSGAERVVSEGR